MATASTFDQREQALDQLREAQRLAVAGRFAASVMHEINGPLEAVCNLNYLIQHHAEPGSAIARYADLIDEQLRTLIHLAGQTLSFCRPAEVERVIPLAGVAEAALRVHEKTLRDKHIDLHTRLASDATAQVHAGEMLQVLSNLVANAIEALPEHGTLHLRICRSASYVHITVADRGHGIPAETLARIFEPFFTTKKERGTGLGLAISQSIVEKHRGTLRSRSSVRIGRSGTIFRISLPRSAERVTTPLSRRVSPG